MDCGVSDVKWIAATQRLIAACDSGVCIVDDNDVSQSLWFFDNSSNVLLLDNS